MDTLKILLVSIIQGITELLPISSSAHIILFGTLLKIDITSTLLVLFHFGTTLAIILFFWKKIFYKLFSKNKLVFLLKLFLASLPAGIAGLLFEDIISSKLHHPWILGISLVFWGIFMIFVERKFTKISKEKINDMEQISWKQAFIIGLSQTVALIPGTSRSGITTMTGILLGLDKYTAFEYSFFLSVPVLGGTFVWLFLRNQVDSILRIVGEPIIPNIIITIFGTLLFSFLTLWVLKKIKRKNWLTFFGIYRICLGILVLLYFYL